MKKIVTILILLSTLGLAKPTLAQEVPNFPACANPQGTLKASYDNGTHGIVGDPEGKKGSDKVYQVDQNTLIQCFCPEKGDGVQTNWWKFSELSQEEIESLESKGWFFIPSGSAWGLTSDPYMARNIIYTCNGGSGGIGGGGQILSAAASTGSVLGLAATGGGLMIGMIFMLAITLLVLGFVARLTNTRR